MAAHKKQPIGVCSNFCIGCLFRKSLYWNDCCDYLIMTDKRRPCPAGDGCTVKVTKKEHRKRKRTQAEKEAFVEKNRERNRKKAKAFYEKHKDEINAKAREKRLANRRAEDGKL